MYKEIVILTKSKKYGKYCVAGIDLKTNKWIRLVKNDNEHDGALGDIDMICDDYTIADVQDVVKVPIAKEIPNGCQTENNLIDRGKWQKLGKMSLKKIVFNTIPIDEPYVFCDNQCCLDANSIQNIDYSLQIAKAENLKIYYKVKEDGSIKVKADFLNNSNTYSMISVTDTKICKKIETQKEIFINKAYIIVSLPKNAYEGFYYKFIAQIFPVDIFYDEIQKFDFFKTYTIKDIIENFELPIFIKRGTWSNDFVYILEEVRDGKTIGKDYNYGKKPLNTGRNYDLQASGFCLCKNDPNEESDFLPW